jgi:hypothetical protein
VLRVQAMRSKQPRNMYTINLFLVKMKEKKLLKIQSLSKVLRSQAMRSKCIPSPNLLLVKMKEKKLLKMQSLPKVLRSQAMRSTT